MNNAFSHVVLVGMLMAAPHSSASAEESCRLGVEIPAKVREHRVVIFGEIHGTSETPALVVEYACSFPERSLVESAFQFFPLPSLEPALCRNKFRPTTW